MILFKSHFKKKHARLCVLMLLSALVALVFSPWEYLGGQNSIFSLVYAAQSGDLDKDGDVDLDDLAIFSEKKFKTSWENIDWCDWANNNSNPGDLIDFIDSYFNCNGGGEPPPPPPPLPVIHSNDYPLRMTRGPNQNLYVSDATVHSVFIYDASLNPTAELTGFNGPLGVAVDSFGNIYVGNRGSYNVEMYDSSGAFVRSLGDGKIKMPNDMAFDQQGNLYIVDSESKKVWVYASSGTLLRTIGSAGLGNGRFKFPCSLIIQNRTNSSGQQVQELYVGDQGQGLIQVFDLQGNFLRAFGGKPTSGMLGYKVKGKFAMLQSLQMDANDRLHVLDSAFNNIQILNPDTGAYITVYGTRGSDPGQLRLPLDMVIDSIGQVVVANYGNKRIETLSMP